MWGFCGCNRREEREEVSPARDMREFVEVRRPCCECKEERVMAENTENNRRRGCGCKRNRRNNMVSPAESSFCQTQLEAARNGCVVNPLTNFSRCNM
ncbi:hypothetical protein ACFCYN_19740 [Gottfriedia sp. NPDC056225]|uniref:hypothetical protein n=1 Tax=Gottfriedia sp. NPDC056225 TaxID=3345751 RepID=UPI0015590196|nr:hypothetical protein HPK19_03600 [Arthrobacter citreus]